MSAASVLSTDPTKIVIRGRSWRGSPLEVQPKRPDAAADAPPKGYVDILLDKRDDAAQIAEVEAAIQAALRDQFGSRIPASYTSPLKDGDEKLATGERKNGEAAKGKMFLRLSFLGDRLPQVVVGQDRRPARPGDYHPGYWVAVSGRAKGYDRAGNRGVSVYLNAAGIVKADEVFASSSVSDLNDIMSSAEDIPAMPSRSGGAGDEFL